MAQYIDTHSVFQAALGDFEQYGFSLFEPDDHILELRFKDNTIGRFNQSLVTVRIIQDSCRNYLKAISRWAQL